MSSIGQVVALLRQRKGLTQRELRDLTHDKIHEPWLAALETDRIKNPPQDKLEVLAACLNTTVLEIYEQAGIVQSRFPDGASPEEKRLLKKFRQLNADQQLALLEFIERTFETEVRVRRRAHGKAKVVKRVAVS